MKLNSLAILSAAAMASAVSLAHASVLVDDFSTTTLNAAYTQTAVLDQGATRNVAYGSPSGTLQAVSTGSDGAEQVLLLRSDFSLGIGQILRADVNVSGINSAGVAATAGLSQDLGIAISAVANPTITNLNGSQRSDYFFSGFRGDATHFIAGGFNGTTSLGSPLQVFGLNITGLYIQRDSATQFEVGYDSGGGPDVSAFTFTLANTAVGNAVGFYTDMRASNTIGQLDNLRIDTVPEPASVGLLAVGAAGLLARRRK